MKDGTTDGQSAAFTPTRLASLERFLDALPTNASGEIDVKDVHARLAESHPSLKEQVEAALPVIILLLNGHACFPFAEEVPVTKDALIRSIGLLTQGCDHMFSQSADVNQKIAIRKRSMGARVDFIFSVLARHDKRFGMPTKDDVLDVLCRVRYPAPSSPSFSQRRPIADLEGMAERLLPSKLPDREDWSVSLMLLRPLADLCNAMRNDDGAEAEKLLVGRESLGLGRQAFREWAKAVSTLQCKWCSNTKSRIDQSSGMFGQAILCMLSVRVAFR
jgi:hypothetical protein